MKWLMRVLSRARELAYMVKDRKSWQGSRQVTNSENANKDELSTQDVISFNVTINQGHCDIQLQQALCIRQSHMKEHLLSCAEP